MQNWIEDKRQTYVHHLQHHTLPSLRTLPDTLYQAFAHTLLPPGKLLRPLLFYAGLDHDHPGAHSVAQALEMLHTYTLVHDDLPCMDDDDERRNRPSCHQAFSESTALLVGDGLQSMAYHRIASCPNLSDQEKTEITLLLSQCLGPHEIIQGQYLDLSHPPRTLEALQQIFILKTGRLFYACMASANLLNHHKTKGIEPIAHALGQLFQWLDDLQDETPEPHAPHVLNFMEREEARQNVHAQIDALLNLLKDQPFAPFIRHLCSEWA